MSNKAIPYKSGDIYERITLTGKAYINPKSRARIVECICECGKIWWVSLFRLKSGHTKSCGCYKKDILTKHGFHNHPIYDAWRSMKDRCYNPKAKEYPNYGGRGIYVCDIWINDFVSFKDWAIENGWEKGLSLDRIDNEHGHYEPNNCRWTTIKVQNRNKRTNVIVNAFGESKCVTDWVSDERCKVGFLALMKRIRKGYDPEKSITTLQYVRIK